MPIIFNLHLIFCRINSCKILASDTYYHKLDAINKKIGILACTAPHGAEDMHGFFFLCYGGYLYTLYTLLLKPRNLTAQSSPAVGSQQN